MCMGGSAKSRNLLTLAAIAAAAYFSGGTSMAATGAAGGASAGAGAGAGAAAGAGAGTAAGVSAGSSVAGGGAGYLGSTSALAGGSSMLPNATAAYLGSTGATAGTGLASGATIGSLLTTASQGLNLAGALTKGAGYYSQLDSYNDLMKKQIAAQREAQANTSAVDLGVGQFTREGQDALAAAAYERRLAAAESGNVRDGSVFLPTSDSAPVEVKSTLGNIINDRIASGRKQQAAGAKLGAYGDVGQWNALTLNDNALRLGLAHNFNQGNQSVLDAARETARIKGLSNQIKSATVGDLLQAGGLFTSGYAGIR